MKLIRNIIIVLIFIVAVIFCLCIAPNYKKSDYDDRTNLVINFKNVTSTMKGEVIRDENNIYISLDDIRNYYDKYIYLDEKYNYIIVSGNGLLVRFDINSDTVEINNKTSKSKVIKKDNLIYLPINLLKDVYNIDVKYNEKTDIVTIESLDKELKQAKLNKSVNVKSKKTFLSRTVEEVDQNGTIYVRESGQVENNEVIIDDSNDIIDKVKAFVKNQKNNNDNDWIYVRTENGTTGYIHKSNIESITTVREEKKYDKETVSIVWDYFENTIAIPKNDSSVSYNGINVVSPSFLFVDENGNIKENIGDSGQKYILWAKSKGYKIWSMVKCDNLLTDNMRDLLNDYKKREKLINQIVESCKTNNFDGVNIDMENINKDDKDAFSRLIIELKPRLENMNMKLSVDVTAPDGSPNWSLCYDRKVIGDVADYIVFMAYDQTSRKSSNAGSNASYLWVENNLKKFIKNNEVESTKIVIAIPFYSRLWKINPDGTVVSGYDINIKNQSKYINKATSKEWLEDAKQNYIEYEESGYTYKMWVEDEKSISQKLDLISEYNLAGAAFWEKGCEEESIWSIIKEKIF